MSDILYNIVDLKEPLKAEITSDQNTEIIRVIIDSREASAGDLFIALRGENNDGHDFVRNALAQGASAAIVDQKFKHKPEENLSLIIVEDTMQALEDLGQYARGRVSAKIIGVTGSVGKTSTKELLSIAFAAHGKTHASIKSYNNHWGVPLTLANMAADCQYGIFEMGMNHHGELTKLSAQVRPDITIITNIEAAHIGHFKDLQDIAKAKSEIMSGQPEDGHVILNADNPYYGYLKNKADEYQIQSYAFGIEEHDEITLDASLKSFKLSSDKSKGTAEINGEKVKFKIGIPGQHMLSNCLTVLLALKLCDLNLEQSIDALKKSEPVSGRGVRFNVDLPQKQGKITIIDESYNANPSSMLAAFKVLEIAEPTNENGRRIAVLGDMLELGAQGPKLHAELANPLLHARADLVFTCGPLMEALFQTLPPPWQGGHAKDSKELATLLTNNVKAGDVILVKGSLGSRMAYIVQALQNIAA